MIERVPVNFVFDQDRDARSQAPTTLLSNGLYNALGEISSQTRADSGADSNTYDNRGRITNHTAGPGPTYEYALGYDGDSNVASFTDTIIGTWTYGMSTAFQSRLGTATCTANCPNGWGAISEAYDEFGNRGSQTVTAGSGPAPSYSYSKTTNRSTTSGVTYDNSGDMTADSLSNTYTYDAENRLKAIGGSNVSASYVYDAFGHRVEQTISGVANDYIFGLDGHIPHYNVSGICGSGRLFFSYWPSTFHCFLSFDGRKGISPRFSIRCQSESRIF